MRPPYSFLLAVAYLCRQGKSTPNVVGVGYFAVFDFS